MIRRQKLGFTLLETLVVLFIISALTLISSPIHSIKTEDYELRMAVYDFLSEIEQAQNYAVITKKAVKVEKETNQGQPLISFRKEESYTTGRIDRIYFPKSSQIYVDSFWINGVTGYIQPETLIFYNNSLRISVKFQFGFGRYVLEEEKR